MTDLPAAPCPRWSLEEDHAAHDWETPFEGRHACPGWPPPEESAGVPEIPEQPSDGTFPTGQVPPVSLRDQLARILAERFTNSKVGKPTEETDWERPVLDTLEDRLEYGMFVMVDAEDGFPSFRTVTPAEVADALAPVLEQQAAEIERLKGELVHRAEADERMTELAADHVNEYAQLYAEADAWAQQLYTAWWSARIGRAQARAAAQDWRDNCLVIVGEREEAKAERDRLSAELSARTTTVAHLKNALGDVTGERDKLRQAVTSYEDGITWQTTCLGCAGLMNKLYEADMGREQAEAERDRLNTTLTRLLEAAHGPSDPPDDLDTFVDEQGSDPDYVAAYVTAALASGQTALATLTRVRELIDTADEAALAGFSRTFTGEPLPASVGTAEVRALLDLPEEDPNA